MGRYSVLSRKAGGRPSGKSNIWGALGSAALSAGRSFLRGKSQGSLPGSSRRKRTVEVAPITSQHDIRTLYRKRRMPRRKKRRYVRTLKRWRSALLRESPARIFQYVRAFAVPWSQDTSRYFGAFMGLFGQNVYDNNFGETWNSITSGNSADAKAEAGYFRLDHQSLRVVLRNVTTVSDADATPTIDLDVYEVICIQDIPLALWASGDSIETFHAAVKNKMRQAQGMDIEVDDVGLGIVPQAQNAGTTAFNQVVGDQLWNNPPFLKYWKIIKQFKVKLGSNNETEFQVRDTRNRYINRADCFGTSALAAKKGVTRGYIFNVNGRAFENVSTDISWNSGKIVCEQYVRYNAKVVTNKTPTLVYDGN
nr:Cap [Lactuca sativa CRESS virus]